MRRFYLSWIVFFSWGVSIASGLEVLVVVGLEGDEEYREVFAKNVNSWKIACAKAEVSCEVMGQTLPPEGEPSIREQLQNRLSEVGEKDLWLVMIGHGSFDGREAKFNIPGDDFSAKELGEWCRDIKGELVVVNTTSSSAPFLKELSGENRTIITATKSANEIFYTRFGTYFSESIVGIPDADLDNDKQVSLLEGFLYASNKVKEFYEQSGRLATEHALIDDNGDGLATRAEWFEGTTAVKMAKSDAEPDGYRAMQQILVENELEKSFPEHLRKRRDELERAVRLLRRQKEEKDETEYYGELEVLLRELGKIYREAGKPEEKPKQSSGPPVNPSPADPLGSGAAIPAID